MEHPLVSVVVSAYNRPELLEIALRSIVQQTFGDLEILVQDDSTEPGCGQVVQKFADPRIRYTRNVPSLGTLANLRAGYRSCSGTYFATLNDDDAYSPVYLQTMVNLLESDHRLSAAFSDHNLIDAKGRVLESETDANSRFWGRTALSPGVVSQPLKRALIDKAVPGMFAVFRREAMDLDDFPDEVASGYDFWLVYLAVREGRPICYAPERLTSYRVHDAMQTSTFSDPRERLYFSEYIRFMDYRFLGDARLEPIWPEVRKRMAHTLCSEGFTYVRLGQRQLALKALQASLRLRGSLRAAIGATLAISPRFIMRLLDKIPGLTTSRS